MKKLTLTIVTAVALTAMLAVAVHAQQQQVALTVTVNNNGQPASGVEVVLELANKNKVASVMTGSDGSASLAVNPLDLANMGKVDVEVTVEQECPDGQTHVTVTVPGQEPEDKGCKRRKKIFAFVLFGGKGQRLTLDIAREAGEVYPTNPGGANPTTPTAKTSNPEARLIWGQIGGDIGVKKFSGANTCVAIVGVTGSASCSGGNKAVAAGVEGTLGFTPYFGIGVDFTRTGRITRSADTSTLTEHSTLGTQFETITGQVFLPLKIVKLSAEGGVAFSQFRETEVQTIGSGSTSSTVVTNLHNHTTGPEIGARVQIPVTNHIAAQVHYMWVRAEHDPTLDEHNNVILFGVVVTLP